MKLFFFIFAIIIFKPIWVFWWCLFRTSGFKLNLDFFFRNFRNFNFSKRNFFLICFQRKLCFRWCCFRISSFQLNKKYLTFIRGIPIFRWNYFFFIFAMIILKPIKIFWWCLFRTSGFKLNLDLIFTKTSGILIFQTEIFFF